MGGGVEPGLRERKKQRTRELIVERAMALFDERGFEHVTIADIAAAADIAPRTFFAYFPAKEAVVFHDFDALFGALKRRIDERSEDESTMEALRAFIAGVLQELDPTDPAELCRRRVVEASDTLREYDKRLIGHFEAAVADGLARDLGEERDSLRVRMVAAAAAAAIAEIERVFDKRVDTDAAMAVFDELFVFIRGGVEALQQHPPAG